MSASKTALRRLVSLVSATTMVGTMAIAMVAVAPAASADTPTGPGPIVQHPTSGVTADALPTVQIDGVVWSQAIVGNTVYAAGSFANARPAGSAAGTNLTSRPNLLAYDIRTGALVTTFAPSLNAQARVVVASPDGKTIYVGGDFTTANGQTRNHVAAYDTGTGSLLSTFAPSVSNSVRAIVASGSSVYVGGSFGSAGGKTRSNLAAFTASNGALTAWAPTADAVVNNLVMTTNGSKVIAGGSFRTINGTVSTGGLAALDPTNGAWLPWAAAGIVKDSGPNAGIDSLSTDGTNVYGSGWVYGGADDGNLEGTFSADQSTGTINWVESCHGDTYGTYSDGTTVYTVSHAHFCGNVGGFPQSDPWSINMRHTLAFTSNATGVNATETMGGPYVDWGGTPSPSMINWFPVLGVGSYTGQSQAAWNVTGNGQYVVEGGEFPNVNGTGQQGLVRFAVSSNATNKQGPIFTSLKPSLVSIKAGTVRASWPAGYDRDDLNLTYKLYRQGTAVPVCTVQASTTFWNQPAVGCVDNGPLTADNTYTYYVVASDPSGNSVTGSTNTIKVTSASLSAYAQKVINDGASTFWRLDQAAGSTAVYDWAGFSDGVASAGVTGGTSGGIIGDSDAASTFSGDSTGLVATQTPITGPNTFTLSAWFNTTSTVGGKIIGFGDKNTGNSSNYDRHIYMDASGKVYFGVYPGFGATLNTNIAYNDGKWHQVVASLSSAGMALYLDGQKIATRSDATSGQVFSGYWRVGGDSPWSGNDYFQGAIDDVAIFPSALSRDQVRAEYLAAGYTLPSVPSAPSDPYGKDVYNNDPQLYWRLGDATGTTSAADSGVYSNPGPVSGGATLGQAGGAFTSVSETVAKLDGTSGLISSNNQASNPTTYTESLWFNTTTTSGGKLIGFGNAQNGFSSGYDRHVYMTNDGRLVFGAYNGNIQTVYSPSRYNDGQWHQVVASQGPDGMNLYVDGALIASNPSYTEAQAYDGWWRVGGDNLNAWPDQPSSSYFAGSISEVAVYSSVLPAAEVANQYALAAPNTPPTAAFTKSQNGTALSVDGSTSSDKQGAVAAYSWNFGDGVTVNSSSPTASHTYAVGGRYAVTLTVTDSGGLTNSTSQQIVVSDAYSAVINASTPYLFWRLGEGSGATTAYDASSSGVNGSYQGGVTFGGAGSLSGSVAPQFDGNTGSAVSSQLVDNPTVYTEEAWFDTTTTAGGKIVGFGNAGPGQGTSGSYDRHIFMDPSGQVVFGAWTGQMNLATSPASYNDGQWHQVVATQGPDGMTLYIDGQSVATNAQTESQPYSGYWHVGGDSSWSGSNFFAGQIDNVSIYSTELGAAAVAQHYAAGSGNAPTAAFTATPTGLVLGVDGSGSTATTGRTISSYDWDWGDDTEHGSSATASHSYASDGTVTVTLTVTDNKGAQSTATKQVSIHRAPDAAFSATPDSTDGLTANVNAGTSKAYGTASIAKYTWDFGEGQPVDTTTPTAAHAYAAAGTYTVQLKVTDDAGAVSTVASQQVTGAHANPTAAFTPSMNLSTVSVDASATQATDSATLSYAWNWGDGTADGSGVNPTHTYANPGPYTITLIVTDNKGGSDSAPAQVTATAHQAPDASLTATVDATDGLTVKVVGTAQPHGSGVRIAKYTWDFGDGSAKADTASGTTSHTYASGGTYTITVVATDSTGAISAEALRPVSPAHANPTVSFTPSTTFLKLSVVGSASSLTDGAVVQSYDWDWADGTGHGNTATADHTYAAAGTYNVKLTVTDSKGGSATTSVPVTVAAHQAPIASFTATPTGLTVAVDGSASTAKDSGVTLKKYTWDFGDNTATVDTTTASASHTYATVGTYTVKLTVTDSEGATGSTTNPVQITVVAQDLFGRSLASGWGSADVGGAWTLGSTATYYSVSSAGGAMSLTSAGTTRQATLGASSTNTNVVTDVSFNKAATGGGLYATVGARRTSAGDYRAKVLVSSTGAVTLYVGKLVGSTETVIKSATISGLSATAGTTLRIRFQVSGTGTAALSAKVWNASANEPSAWQVTTTDATSTLQTAGGYILIGYQSGSSTNAPVIATFDNFTAIDLGP